MPLGILHDGLAADFVERDRLGAFARGRGHRNHAPHETRVFDAPLENLHSAHRASNDAGERSQTEVVAQQLLRAHHVANRDKGKRQAERPARGGIERERPARALAAAEDVGAEHEKPARVDRLAWADEIVPPTRLRIGQRMDAGAMMVAAERMADDDRVVPGGIEMAVRFIAQRELRQHLAALEDERLGMDKIARLDETDLSGLGGCAGNVILRVVHEHRCVNHRIPRMNTDFCVIGKNSGCVRAFETRHKTLDLCKWLGWRGVEGGPPCPPQLAVEMAQTSRRDVID